MFLAIFVQDVITFCCTPGNQGKLQKLLPSFFHSVKLGILRKVPYMTQYLEVCFDTWCNVQNLCVIYFCTILYVPFFIVGEQAPQIAETPVVSQEPAVSIKILQGKFQEFFLNQYKSAKFDLQVINQC